MRLRHDGNTLGLLPWKYRVVVAQHRPDRDKDAVPAKAPSARLGCAGIEPTGSPSADTSWRYWNYSSLHARVDVCKLSRGRV